MNKPLSDIRVIDLTRVLAGPFCTMILNNLGAQIIKVEAIEKGDDARHFGPFIDADPTKSAYFYSVNCGKKSICLNLKNVQGKAVLTQLIKKADVLVENFRPGTFERLGFGDKAVKKLNPNIIYASASGFGHSGPESQKPAYDSIIQALSGLISITGTDQGQTVRVGTSISDIITGMYAAIGSRHPSITPFETFQTKDSEIMIAAGNDKLFSDFCDVLERPDLALDDRFATNLARTENHARLKKIIEKVLIGKSAAHWLYALNKKMVPCAKINNMKDLFAHKQLKNRNMLLPIEGEKSYKIAGNPIKFKEGPEEKSVEKPPSLGEHTETVLKNILGYSDDAIASLEKMGAVARLNCAN